jgi:hypothetical protein
MTEDFIGDLALGAAVAVILVIDRDMAASRSHAKLFGRLALRSFLLPPWSWHGPDIRRDGRVASASSRSARHQDHRCQLLR